MRQDFYLILKLNFLMNELELLAIAWVVEDFEDCVKRLQISNNCRPKRVNIRIKTEQGKQKILEQITKMGRSITPVRF